MLPETSFAPVSHFKIDVCPVGRLATATRRRPSSSRASNKKLTAPRAVGGIDLSFHPIGDGAESRALHIHVPSAPATTRDTARRYRGNATCLALNKGSAGIYHLNAWTLSHSRHYHRLHSTVRFSHKVLSPLTPPRAPRAHCPHGDQKSRFSAAAASCDLPLALLASIPLSAQLERLDTTGG